VRPRRICQSSGVSRQLMTCEKPDGGLTSDLSSREREVMELLAGGCSTAEIGRRLFIAKSTVRSHIAAIVHKLPVKDRATAVALLRASDKEEEHLADP
jgi:DNA-binding NarL/FixJ family response regulator